MYNLTPIQFRHRFQLRLQLKNDITCRLFHPYSANHHQRVICKQFEFGRGFVAGKTFSRRHFIDTITGQESKKRKK